MRNLPPELIDQIISYLDNQSFNICQNIRIFRVASSSEIRRRKYESKSPLDLAKSGNLEAVKYHLERGSRINWIITSEAVKSGHLPVVKYLVEQGFHPSETSLDRAASKGYLKILKYFYQNSLLRCSQNGLRYAASNSYISVVKYLIGKGIPVNQPVLHIAAQYSTIEMTRLLYFASPTPPEPVVMAFAARSGNIDLIKFYAALGIPVAHAVKIASELGRLSILDYLLTNHSDEIDTNLLIDCLAKAKERNHNLVINHIINFIKSPLHLHTP